VRIYRTKIATRLGAAALGVALLAGGLTGCSWPSEEETYEAIECDVDDQKERDDDCGYADAGGVWIWYAWVVLGQRSFSPYGWTPPEGVQITGQRTKRTVPEQHRQSNPGNQNKQNNPPKANNPGPAKPASGGGRVGGGTGGRR
jgi:hypothetical protein